MSKLFQDGYRIQFQYSNENIQFGIYDEVSRKNINTCTIPISKMPNDFQTLYAQYNLICK